MFKSFALATVALAALSACGSQTTGSAERFAPSFAPPPVAPAVPTGSIYASANYASLVEDNRARRVGDVLTISIVERTRATKSATATASRSSDYGLRLPDTAPFNNINPGLFTGGTDTSFDGGGQAAQSNQLNGEVTVTVAEVLSNGVLLVRGRKLVTINRGDEYINISGLVRPEDIGPDNRVPSTRVANAEIAYAGSGEIADQSRQGFLARLLTRFSPF